jgi:chemotaxis signal transduction protein
MSLASFPAHTKATAVTSLEDLVPHMRRVQSAERDLHDLGLVWQMIESSAAISCPEEVAPILPTLIRTRERFDDLQARLIRRMASENQAELGDELASKAQCAIDILVRNLYERTADVGFLATDDVVRSFCAAAPAERATAQAAMVRRLAEYQAKYTVYDDVILLSPQGEVLARLDAAASVACSADAVIAEALARPGYVERFGLSDLGDDRAAALLYAHRIETGGRVVGVLVLRFRFADEMRRVFDDVGDDSHHTALLLVDDARRVIATNDESHVPTGATLAAVAPGAIALTSFAGRDYLAVCCASAGYQGYKGPSWRAIAMVSLLTAFRPRTQAVEERTVPLDNPELVAIDADADAINRDLRRVVWNGRLMAGEQRGDRVRLKAVLSQVNHAGLRTRERVNGAIRDLYRTSLARARQQTHELARLAADIMDRNLYERANDCRWWALSPVLQRVLAAPANAAGTRELNAVLDHINGLYTVYNRLVAFDAEGTIRGVSRAEGSDFVGSAVPPAWREAVRGLAGSQHYAVSAFEDTPLHDAGPTYVYLAAVQGEGGRFAGGIAIVFNAATELAAMLRDIASQRAGFAAFVDAGHRVLASTDAAVAQGAVITFEGEAAIVEHEGAHYACARVRAAGYREFKTSDGYANGVSAIVALRLGAVERRMGSLGDVELSAPVVVKREGALEAAVFQVGPSRYALPSNSLLQAVSQDGLVRTPGGGNYVGMLEVGSGRHARMVQVLCARKLLGAEHPARAGDGVVLVLRSTLDPDVPAIGLRVDDVLTVIEMDRERVHPAPPGLQDFAPWAAGMLDLKSSAMGQDEPVLVTLLDPAVLCAPRRRPAAVADAVARV